MKDTHRVGDEKRRNKSKMACLKKGRDNVKGKEKIV